ncbi:hypothetical protein YC2023_115699 [Brassica napus]
MCTMYDKNLVLFLPNHHLSLEKASADDTKHLLSHVTVDKSNHTLDYRESRLKTIIALPSPSILFWLVTLDSRSFIFDYGLWRQEQSHSRFSKLHLRVLSMFLLHLHL